MTESRSPSPEAAGAEPGTDVPDGRLSPVAVLGAGTMGHGIAQVSAMAGFETRLQDVDGVALDRAREHVEANLERGVELEKVAPGERETTLAHLSFTTEAEEATGGARIVIEAVPERLALKRRVLSEAAGPARPGALLASNTSSLSITAIGEGVPDPERLVGMHFFNPVHIMELVEVVEGERSDEEAVDRALAFARRLGKTPIRVQDSPGFASSRLGVALGLEAIRMVEEGVASPEDIDRAMTLGYRHPMGPLKLTDVIGLDVRLEIARYLEKELGKRFRPPALLAKMVEDGRLGKKTGRGFYDW